MKIKLSTNTWFLLGCIGIVAAFVLLPVLFGSKENYEVKNTMPVLPVENEVLMRGNEITREDVTEIIGRSNKKMTNQITEKSFGSDSNSQQPKTQSISSTIGLSQSEQSIGTSSTLTAVDDPSIGGTQKKVLGKTKDGKVIVGYTKDGTPIVELEAKKVTQPDHWSEIKRDGNSVSEQMGKTKRQMVPIKATAKVKLDHAISNLDGSSTVLCTISSDSIGKLNDLNGSTIKGTFYSIKDSNKMFIQFSKIISKKGTDISISAYAISADGSAGIPAQIDSNVGNEVVNFLTAQILANQTNDVSRIVLDKTVGQSELETEQQVTVERGTRFKIYFDEPVFI